jgi:hypothetical protein
VHIDYTLAFWPTLTKLAGIIAVCTFLFKVYHKIGSGVDAVKALVAEHEEMYGWYQSHVKPNGAAVVSQYPRSSYESD